MFAGCCLFAGWTLILWLIPHWLYLPNWVPIPGYRLMAPVTCFGPLMLLIVALPTLAIFFLVVFLDSAFLLRQIISQSKQGIRKLGIGLVIVSLPAFLWIFGKRIDDALVRYAISRYNVDIDAIEQYYEDYGEYPATLDALVPDYLPRTPGIYMKYGEILKYDPNSEWGYVGHGPFTFELYGHDMSGWHGQTLKYCPVEDNSCAGFNRIDERWVWAYASAL
jgi:hypothetical protein